MIIQRTKKFMLALPLFVLAFSLVACSGGGDGGGSVKVLPPVTVIKDRTPSFGFSQIYGRQNMGYMPKVGITANGLVVEVIEDSPQYANLYCQLGQVNEKGKLTWQSSVNYDNGHKPDVAVNRWGKVVEVHETSTWFSNDLWYHVGQVCGDSICWGPSIKYDTGYNPHVTIDDWGHVLEVHRGADGDFLYYKFGRMNADGTGIYWTDSVRYDWGVTPDVAMSYSKYSNVVVEVHRGNTNSQLYYYVGHLDYYNDTISWGAPVYYADGYMPSVDITDDGLVLAAHQSSGKLYYLAGMVSGNSIIWHASGEIASGPDSGSGETRQNPDTVSVACRGDHAIQVHDCGMVATYSANSLLLNRKRWMQNMPLLWARPLWKTVLPGTHDSGAYNLSLDRVPANCRDAPDSIPAWVVQPFATAQSKSLGKQLAGGIRYFDIRPVFHNNDFYMYHDCIGSQPFSKELDDVADFLAQEGPELVILNIGAFCSFDGSVHERFVNLINNKIGQWLYKGSTDGLLARTMGELMVPNANVFLIYGDDYIVSHPTPGFIRTLPINGLYTGTTDLNAMWADQRNKLRTESTPSNLFMLNWTLTFRSDHWLDDVTYFSLYNISKAASRNLGNFINETYNGTPNTNYQMNILSVDFFEDTKNVDYAVWLNSLH